MTVCIYTPLFVVSLFTDEGSLRLLKRLIHIVLTGVPDNPGCYLATQVFTCMCLCDTYCAWVFIYCVHPSSFVSSNPILSVL